MNNLLTWYDCNGVQWGYEKDEYVPGGRVFVTTCENLLDNGEPMDNGYWVGSLEEAIKLVMDETYDPEMDDL